MNREKIARINKLAKKSKTEGLTIEERAEQAVLRKEYLDTIKRNFKAALDNIEFTDKE